MNMARIGKHNGCGGELCYGNMSGEGLLHVEDFTCEKCGASVKAEDVESYNEALKREYGNLLKEPMKAERG